jgi:GxxExxY protein
MNMLLGDEATNAITEKIIGCAFRVRDRLKCGFLEKVYENAMVIELTKAGLRVRQQAPVPVYYDGIIVGDYVADLIVEDAVIVELKAVRSIDQIHVAQCLNYLAATGKQICLLQLLDPCSDKTLAGRGGSGQERRKNGRGHT